MTDNMAQLAENTAQAADFLKAMSNPNRLMVLCTLLDKEMSVAQLNQHIPLSQSALSQHLAALRKASLVNTRREAQTVFYTLADDKPAKMIALLKECFCPEPEET